MTMYRYVGGSSCLVTNRTVFVGQVMPESRHGSALSSYRRLALNSSDENLSLQGGDIYISMRYLEEVVPVTMRNSI